MKTNAFYSRVLLILTAVLFICLFFDFLALHDVYRDYASKLVMNRFSAETAGSLPEWTNTSGEWSLLQISYIIKLIIAGFTFFFLFAIHKNSINSARNQ